MKNPRKVFLAMPALFAASIKFVWICKFSDKNSTGCLELAPIPPTLAAAMTRTSGDSLANSLKTDSRLVKFKAVEGLPTTSAPRLRASLAMADPTMPRIPAI